MDWNKSTMSKAELEKKQREFMEEAMQMAKKAGYKAEKTETAPAVEEETAVELHEEEIVSEIPDLREEMCENDTECEEISDLPTDTASEELSEENEITEEDVADEEKPSDRDEEETTYGVFDAEELIDAIESGEITGDGLKQAAEILREMTDKTEAMKKLLMEQERKMSAEKKSDDGSQLGLNSYIDRHNTGCRGCRNGKFNTH